MRGRGFLELLLVDWHDDGVGWLVGLTGNDEMYQASEAPQLAFW